MPDAQHVKPRLGEELPIFCEKCGYSLNGLTPVACSHCSVLQFHCPECGHHQPINTLRPAFQRILGRLRAFFLAMWVFLRINFFFWLLLAWYGMGGSWAYNYEWNNGNNQMAPFSLSWESIVVFTFFAAGFASVGRMLLLRWKHGLFVGLSIAVLTLLAISGGALTRRYGGERISFSPFNREFTLLLIMTFCTVTLAATLAWPVWTVCVRLFLRRELAEPLLDWQRGFCRRAATLARE